MKFVRPLSDAQRQRYSLKRLIGSLGLALCAGVMPLASTQAANPVDIYEGFDYPTGTNLNSVNGSGESNYSSGANGGTGWKNGWGGGLGDAAKRVITDGSLTYSNVTSTGNKAQLEGSRIFRHFAEDLTEGHTYYIQVLLQGDPLEDSSTYFGLQFADTGNIEKLLIGRQTNYTNWMVAGSGSGVIVPTDHPLYNSAHPYTLSSNHPIDAGAPALLLVKLEMRPISDDNPEGLERLTFWVNPDLSQSEDVSTAIGGQAFDSNGDYGALHAVRIGSGGTGNAGYNHSIDEILISQYPPFPHGRIVVESPAGTPLVNGESSTSFGAIPFGESTTRVYTIRNIGTGTLSNLAVSVSGTNASEFSVGDLSTTTLAPGASTTVEVTLTPEATGMRNAILTIHSDDTVIDEFTVGAGGMSNKANQTITFTPSGDQFISELLALEVNGGDSGEDVEITVFSGPAVVEGGQLRFTGSGRVTILMNQAGNDDYLPASPVTYTFDVLLPRPDIAVGPKPTKLVGVNQYAPTKQLSTILSKKARKATGHIGIANRVSLPNSRAADKVTVRGKKGNANFKVKYQGPGGNLTSAVTTGRYQTAVIDGNSKVVALKMIVTPNKKKVTKKNAGKTVFLKKTFSSPLQASSVAYPSAKDKATLRVQTKKG